VITSDLSGSDTSVVPKVFIDTMVLIYHLVGCKEELSKKTEAFLEDLEKIKYRGAITTFTKAEYLAVAKKWFSRQQGRKPSRAEQDRIESQLESFIQDMGLEVYDADRLIEQQDNISVFADCGRIVKESRPIKGSDDHWLMVGAADSIVIKLAEYAYGDYLATFDDSLQGLSARLRPLDLRRCY